jgi:hypothetical protein
MLRYTAGGGARRRGSKWPAGSARSTADSYVLYGVAGWTYEFITIYRPKNSKKTPHFRGKYANPPVLREIAKIHRFYKNKK